MTVLTSTFTGNVWPGELEISRIDAPNVQYAMDPTLPILGVDPRFPSDQIVVARGRLVGLKGDVTLAGGVISSTKDHTSYLTLADGVNVPALGYAAGQMTKEWSNKANGVMKQITRNGMIAVPFVSGVNNAYGLIQPGDAVTAYKGADVRLTGCIAKYVAREFFEAAGGTSDVVAVTGYNTPFKPKVIAAYGVASAYIDPATVTVAYNGTDGKWEFGATGITSVVYSYGQSADMIAGQAYGVETNNDLPGFLKWVTDNFGAWSVYPMFAQLGNTATEAAHAFDTGVTDGFLTLAAPTRLDPAKRMLLKVKAAHTVYVLNEGSEGDDTGDFTAYVAGSYLPLASWFGADNTQGQNYTIDHTTGAVQYWGLYSDNTGTKMVATDADDALELVASAQSIAIEPAYGMGQVGISPDGIPSQFLTDPATGESAIGILKVAIH